MVMEMAMKSGDKRRPVVLCTGADRRQIYAAERLARFAKVYTYRIDGIARGAEAVGELGEMPKKADILLLPMPCGNGLAIPCAAGRLCCGDLAPALSEHALVTGGKMGREMLEYFSSKGFDTADYLLRGELAVKNCVPTAEGTLALAMNELDVTISGTRTLIIGWGRVAKACARLFSAAGARVAVAARKREALAEAESMGLEAFDINELFLRAGGFMLIINTVPAMVLTGEVIKATREDCLIIDLASKPGGTDQDACERMSRRFIHALSLPGKCAPVTAGEIIADTVMNIYHERSGSNVT